MGVEEAGGMPIVATFVQLACIRRKNILGGGKDRTIQQILFISPREKEETLMTVGPELSLFLYQIMKKNKRPIYPIEKKKKKKKNPHLPPRKKKKKKKKS